MEFSELDLHPHLLDGIEALNYTTATPIQEQAIPLILEGRDIVGVAQTGTGKTAAFVLPVLNKILESGEQGFTQALIVVPTRELAVQIDKVVEAYSYYTGISSMAIYGGVDGKGFSQEKTAITEGTDIIIATPGRLIAHINLGYVDFKDLRFLILDEADRMMDMGFKPDLLKITAVVGKTRQTLLFSATMPSDVAAFANTLVNNPARISIAVSKPAAGVVQKVFQVTDRQKLPLMVDFLQERIGQRIIVFGSTKISVSELYKRLSAKKMNVGMISSDVEQAEREQVMTDFRSRKIDILVATDVLSRGIDVDNIEVVVNYDVPRAPEDYVHRIGRTARAEKTGMAVTLVSPEDQVRFVKIERFLNKKVEVEPLPAHFFNWPYGGGNSGRPNDRRGGNDRNRRPERGENRRPSGGQNDRRDGQNRGAKPHHPRPEGQNRPVQTENVGGENQLPKEPRPVFSIKKAVAEDIGQDKS